MGIPFSKYHGLRNDFVVIDARAGEAPDPDAALARRLCDRRGGVGADGVLWLVAGPTMVVLNADGTRAEACGNGLRCVVRHLADAGDWPETGEGSVDTDAGTRRCKLLPYGRIWAELGPARVLALDGLGEDVGVDVGNPHRVRFGGSGAELAQREGPRLAQHPGFPAGVNVGFAFVGADGLSLTVWERGSGLTAACGSGACAAAAAAVHLGLVEEGSVRVLQGGGELIVDVGAAGADGERPVALAGPAEFVFSGEVEL